MPISLFFSLPLLSGSFTKPMNPMEVTPSEFDRHPWGVCRWFKTLGACNVSPIEHVRLHKGSISRVYVYIYIYTTGFQRLFAWRPRFKTRQSRASVAQDRWVMVERFELLPRVDVCMNHWPIFIAIFTGSRGCPPIIYRKTGGKPIDLSFNYSSSNGQLLLLRISFSFIAINLWIAIGSQFLRFVEFWKLNFLFKSKWRRIFTNLNDPNRVTTLIEILDFLYIMKSRKF